MELSEFPHFPEKSPFSTGLGISSGFSGVLLFSPSTWKIKEIHYHEQITDVCTAAAWLPACGWQRRAWAHGQATGQVALGMLRDISPCLGCHLPALGKPCHLCASVAMSKKRITELQLIKMMFHRSHQAPQKRCSVQTAVWALQRQEVPVLLMEEKSINIRQVNGLALGNNLQRKH